MTRFRFRAAKPVDAGGTQRAAGLEILGPSTKGRGTNNAAQTGPGSLNGKADKLRKGDQTEERARGHEANGLGRGLVIIGGGRVRTQPNQPWRAGPEVGLQPVGRWWIRVVGGLQGTKPACNRLKSPCWARLGGDAAPRACRTAGCRACCRLHCRRGTRPPALTLLPHGPCPPDRHLIPAADSAGPLILSRDAQLAGEPLETAAPRPGGSRALNPDLPAGTRREQVQRHSVAARLALRLSQTSASVDPWGRACEPVRPPSTCQGGGKCAFPTTAAALAATSPFPLRRPEAARANRARTRYPPFRPSAMCVPSMT